MFKHFPTFLTLGFALALMVVLSLFVTSVRAADLAPGGVHRMVTWSALNHGVPPALAHGVVRVESGYKCGARNARSSAKGIMQVLDRTAHGVGVRGNRLSCQTGLEAGMRYLRQAYQRAQGNLCVAATLYNRGVGGARTCSGYGRKVLSLAGH